MEDTIKSPANESNNSSIIKPNSIQKKNDLKNIHDRNLYLKSISEITNTFPDTITAFLLNVEYGLDRGRVTHSIKSIFLDEEYK